MWDLIVSVPDHCLSFYFTSFPRKKIVSSIICYQTSHKKDVTHNDT